MKVSSGVAIQAMKLGTSSNEDFNFALKTSSFLPGNIVANEAFDSNRVEIGLKLPATLLRWVDPSISKLYYFLIQSILIKNLHMALKGQ